MINVAYCKNVLPVQPPRRWPMNTYNHASKPVTATKTRALEISSITILIVIAVSSVVMNAFVLRYAFFAKDSHVVSQVLYVQAINQTLLLMLSGSRKGEEIAHCAMKVIEKIVKRFV
jgi:hypothetical protein